MPRDNREIEKSSARTFFRQSLTGDRLAVIGIIISALTLPFVWWLGLVGIAFSLFWIAWSYKDWKKADENHQNIWLFLKEAFWDSYQYEYIPKELEPEPIIEDAVLKPTSKPIFKILPVTTFPYSIILDANVFKATNKLRSPKTMRPIIVSFENIPKSDGFGENDEVWAHIIFREGVATNLELARVSSGCWIDEPLADITFPFRKARHLVLGGWYVKQSDKNEFRMFEYSRELHRPVEKKIKLASPRNLMIDVILTPNGHHELSCEYNFDITLFSPLAFGMNRHRVKG